MLYYKDTLKYIYPIYLDFSTMHYRMCNLYQSGVKIKINATISIGMLCLRPIIIKIAESKHNQLINEYTMIFPQFMKRLEYSHYKFTPISTVFVFTERYN